MQLQRITLPEFKDKRWWCCMILTKYLQAAMLILLPHCSTGLASRNIDGVAAIMRFFYARSSARLYVGLGGAVARLAGSVDPGRPTSFSPAPMIGLMLPGNSIINGVYHD
jgi:hypothetical protein